MNHTEYIDYQSFVDTVMNCIEIEYDLGRINYSITITHYSYDILNNSYYVVVGISITSENIDKTKVSIDIKNIENIIIEYNVLYWDDMPTRIPNLEYYDNYIQNINFLVEEVVDNLMKLPVAA